MAAVVPREIGRAPAAALEAQAVAARSYALARGERHLEDGADLCDGTHCQVFHGLSAATEDSRRAAAATAGLVLTQKGRVIAAPFHAVCGGRTARPRDVWDDEEIPDLESVEDDACLGAPGATWSFTIPRAALSALSGSLGFPGARFFEVYGHDASGRVSMVRFAAPGGASRVVRGFEFRRAASELLGLGLGALDGLHARGDAARVSPVGARHGARRRDVPGRCDRAREARREPRRDPRALLPRSRGGPARRAWVRGFRSAQSRYLPDGSDWPSPSSFRSISCAGGARASSSGRIARGGDCGS